MDPSTTTPPNSLVNEQLAAADVGSIKPQTPAPATRKRSVRTRLYRNPVWGRVLPISAVVLLLAFWQLAADQFVKQSLILVAPSKVVSDLWDWVTSGTIWPDLQATGIELGVGFLLSVVVGVGLGVIMGTSWTADRFLSALVTGFNAVPILAVVPLFIIWLGIGLTAKVCVVFVTAVFPMIINTREGLLEVDRSYLDVVRSFGAGPIRSVVTVSLPATVPYVFAGAKLAIARAVTATFVAELFGATHGVGFAINSASTVFDTPRVYSGIVVLSLMGVVGTGIVSLVERLVAPWRFHSR